MSTANLDHNDLSDALAGGLVRESVLDAIFQIDGFPLPVTNMCMRDTSGNRYHEWTKDSLGAPTNPKTPNAKVDGQDMSDNDETIGTREGTHLQIMTKQLNVSHRANDATTIGRAGTLAYQISQAQKRIRRDLEMHIASDVASVEGTDTVAGVTAGLVSWLTTNYYGGATGSANGFNTTTKLTAAPTFGTARALTETLIRDCSQAIYEAGGTTRVICGTPTVIRALSFHLLSSSARIATLTDEKGVAIEPGDSSRARGSVSVFTTDFGQILRMEGNRLHPLRDGNTDTNISNLIFIDPAHIRLAYLQGLQVRPLARLGLSERRIMSQDVGLVCTQEAAHGVIADIDETAAVTA